MKSNGGGNKPMGLKKTGNGFKSAKSGTKSTGSGSASGLKKKKSNILRFDPLKMMGGGRGGASGSKAEMPEDEEIRYLQKMLGMNSKRDLKGLMGEFAEEGLDDFLDLIFDESVSLGLEDDGTTIQRPVYDINKPEESGISLEEFMGMGDADGDQEGEDGQNDHNNSRGPSKSVLDEDSDSDAQEEVLIGTGSDKRDAEAMKSMKQAELGGKGTKSSNPSTTTSQKNTKMRALAASSRMDDSSDDDNHDVSMNDGDGNGNFEDLDDIKKQSLAQKQSTTKQSTKTPTPGAPLKMADKYYPPHILRRLGLGFDKVAFRDSFVRYLSQNDSFVDTRNSADQNAYTYHGVMTDVKSHMDLYMGLLGKLNKLSHLNIGSIFTEIVTDFIIRDEVPVGTLIDIVTISVQDFCMQQRSILTSTVQALGVIPAGLHKVFGTQFGSLMVESFSSFFNTQISLLYSEYVKKYSSNVQLSKHGVIYLNPIDLKPILNIVDILGTMYLMSCVPFKFMTGLCDWVLHSTTLFTVSGDVGNDGNEKVDVDGDGSAAKKNKTSTQNTKSTATPTESQSTQLNQDIKWSIQCQLLGHILTNFGLQLRKDDGVQVRTLMQTILERSSGYESNWSTQELVSIISDVKSNKQHVGLGEDEGAKKDKDNKSAAGGTTIDYVGLHAQMYTAMNFILDNFNEDLLEKSTAKTGRKESKKQQLQKQLDALKQTASNKQSIATKHQQRNLINVSFQDILKVRETGRWWVVGSGFRQTQSIIDQNLLAAAQQSKSLLDSDSDQENAANNDDDSDDDDVLVKTVNTKVLAEQAKALGFKSPLERYIFQSIVNCSMSLSGSDGVPADAHIRAYSKISSKHSNHISSTARHDNSLSIAPSQYGEVCSVILKTAMGQEVGSRGTAMVGMCANLFGKLLASYPHYRFALCASFWDAIQTLQQSFIDSKRDLDQQVAKKIKDKAKIAALTQQQAKVTQQTSNLARLLALVISQPLTIDFYALRKMAFTPMMYVMMVQGGDDDEQEGDEAKSKSKSIFGAQLINPDDINSMNDNTILFLHTLIETLCETFIDFDTETATQRLKDIVVTLQGPDLTNYMTMDKDILKLQFTTISKYDQVKNQNKVVKPNFDGKRILSCLIESTKQIVLPMVSMVALGEKDVVKKAHATKVKAVVELFLKTLQKDHVKRK